MLTPPIDENRIRESFVATFRAVPPGGVLYVEHTANWCTSIAHSARRKIKTKKSISLQKRGGQSIDVTRVEFIGEPKKRAEAKGSTADPRQLLIPTLEAVA